MQRIATILAILGVSLATRVVDAKPEFVRLSLIGDTSTTMGVAWSTLSGKAEATLKYGLASGRLTLTATGKVNPKISTVLGSTSEVLIRGLKPSTRYFYRVGGSTGGFSKEYSFRTGPILHPQCGVFRFAFVGDSRAERIETNKGSSVKWPMISMKMAAFKPAFALHGGDFVYDGKNEKQWAHMLLNTTAVSSIVPIMYTLGNHDDGPSSGEAANFNKVLYLPRGDKALGGSGTEDFYHFVYGNAIFVSLSTETFTGGSSKFQQQAAWMDKVFTQHPKRWKVVFLHKPIYTQGPPFVSHPPNEAGQNRAFVEVFNNHHVDLVIGSHNHFYERFVPSKCKNTASTNPCAAATPAQGTVYMTSGGAGAFPIFFPLGTNNVRAAVSGSHHFLIFDVNNNTLMMRTIDDAGKEVDRYTITEPPPKPDPCAKPLSQPDAGAPAADGSTRPKDASSPATDAQPKPSADAKAVMKDAAVARNDSGKAPSGDGTGGATPKDKGGCSCRAATGTALGAMPAWLLLFGLALRRRRRR